MSISCPGCDKSELSPTTLEDYLPARICLQCRGTLLSLIAYRDWRNTHALPARAANNIGEASNVADSTKLLRCPHCAGLMTKFRFSADAKNQIDLCDRCDLVWLDHGEWVLVEHLVLSGQLAKVFDATGRSACVKNGPAVAPRSVGACNSAKITKKYANCVRGWRCTHRGKGQGAGRLSLSVAD